MPRDRRIIRDFLYEDIDRLYSIYSQVFQGVAGQIVESFTNQAASKESGRSAPLTGRTLEEQVVELSTHMQVKWLHDHMYNTLEEKLGSVMIEDPELTPGNYEQVLSGCFLLKVQGAAEISDYHRLTTFLEKYNELGEAIAFSHLLSVTGEGAAAGALEREHAAPKDRNERVRAREMEKRKTDPKAIAQAMGLRQNPELLKRLKLFLDFFGMDPFEVVVSAGEQSMVTYRGVLDRKWLRVSPDLVRSLYGTVIESPVTMVGQITHLPRARADKSTTSEELPPFRQSSEANPSMRDSYQNMFKAARALEHMFLESDRRIEVVVCPLAIYREREIEIGELPA